jgi:hypothetical protein
MTEEAQSRPPVFVQRLTLAGLELEVVVNARSERSFIAERFLRYCRPEGVALIWGSRGACAFVEARVLMLAHLSDGKPELVDGTVLLAPLDQSCDLVIGAGLLGILRQLVRRPDKLFQQKAGGGKRHVIPFPRQKS